MHKNIMIMLTLFSLISSGLCAQTLGTPAPQQPLQTTPVPQPPTIMIGYTAGAPATQIHRKRKKRALRKKFKRPLPQPANVMINQQQLLPATQAPVVLPNNLPTGFDEVGADAEAITVGSRKDGKIEAWKVGDDDYALYRYDENATTANAWVKQVAKEANGTIIQTFNDVAASSDGLVCAVSSTGRAYMLNMQANLWEEIPTVNASRLKFGKIAVGNGKNIWAIEKATNNIYQCVFDKTVKLNDITLYINEWELKSRNGLDIAAGIDGTVMAVSTQNKVYQLVKNNWKEVPGLMLSTISVGSKNSMWGTLEKGPIHEVWQFAATTWQKVRGANGQDAQGFTDIAVNASGSAFAIDSDGIMYYNNDIGVSVIPVKPEQLSQLKPDQYIQLDPGFIAMTARTTSKRAEAKKAGLIPKLQKDAQKLALKRRRKKRLKVARPGMRRGGIQQLHPPQTPTSMAVQKPVVSAPAQQAPAVIKSTVKTTP